MNQKRQRTEAVSARISLEAKEELDRIALEEQRTLSQVVAMAIDEGLKVWRARREGAKHKA
jgi:hypothetical protein